MQTLKDSELRYRRLFETAQDGILLLNAETGMIEDVNPYLIKMLGYSREEFIKRKLWEVGAFKDSEASQDAFEILQDREYIRYEDLPLKTKDGRLIQVEFVSNVYMVGDQKVIQCDIRDITKHRRIIAALQENEKKYHDLINQSPDGYFIIEYSGSILTVNEAMCKELEFSQEEMLALHIWDIIPENYLDQYKARLTKVLSGESLKEATEYQVRGKSGKIHYVEVLSAPRYSGGDVIGFQGVARDITARKDAERALQASEENFRQLVVHLPTVVYVNAVGDASTTLYVSPQIEALLGYTPQEWLADPKLWSKTLHPEDRTYVLKQTAHTDLSNKPYEIEYRMLARDGHVVWVHDQIVLVNDAEGKPRFWQGIMLDITERKRSEAELYASEDRFKNAFQYSAIGMALVSLEGRWLKVNSFLCSILGYSEAELLTKTFQEITHPADLDADVINRNRLVAGEFRSFKLEKRYFHKTGRIVWVLLAVALAKDSAGVPLYYIAQMEDITEHKLTQAAVRESEARFGQVWEVTSDAMALSDPEGIVLAANPAYLELYGYKLEQVVNKSFAVIFPEAEREQALEQYRTVFASEGIPPTFEATIRRMDGTERIVESNATFLTTAGRRTHMLSVIRDVTERKQSLTALQEKQQLLSEAQRLGHIGSWSYGILTDTLQYSDEMYHLLDVSPQEFQHNQAGLLSLTYATDRPLVTKWLEEIRAGRQVKELDFRLFHKNGELRYLQVQGAVIFDAAGKPVRFAGTAQDVSERKLAEIQIRQQVQRLTALGKIDQAIISTAKLSSVMKVILAQAVNQLQVDAADILLLNNDSQLLEHVLGIGFRTQGYDSARVPVDASLAGRVAQERRLLKIDNLKEQPADAFISGLVAKEGFVAYMGVPLIIKGRVRAVLELYHRAPLYPDAEWLDFLNTLAGQAVIAIENDSLVTNLEHTNWELSQAYDATIAGWSRALDLRDKETEGHSQRVTELTVRLARLFGFSEAELVQVRRGALLHDIGKMGVPDVILFKPGELTDEEWAVMKMHPTFAHELLAPIHYLRQALDIPYCHHEKWDGSGYPRGLKGEQIPRAARIFAVVDVWDALCSGRPYRPGWPKEKVREHILASAGTHFDPQVVAGFIKLIDPLNMQPDH